MNEDELIGLKEFFNQFMHPSLTKLTVPIRGDALV